MNETLSFAEWAGLSRERQADYAFLSRLYREELAEPELLPLLQRAAAEPVAGPDEGETLLHRFALAHATEDPGPLVMDLRVEYARLFYNAGDPPHVYPYESVYTSPSHLLMQAAQQQVMDEYRSGGLTRAPGWTEPEDHIASELEYMAYLCGQSAAEAERTHWPDLRRAIERQLHFVTEHLLTWVPQFCSDLAQASRSDFYRSLALLTAAFVADDAHTLSSAIPGAAP